MNGLLSARLAAGQTGYALHVILGLIETNPHGTDVMAGLTLGTSALIKGQSDQLYFMEKRIKGAKGAGCSAKGPARQNSPDYEDNENEEF